MKECPICGSSEYVKVYPGKEVFDYVVRDKGNCVAWIRCSNCRISIDSLPLTDWNRALHDVEAKWNSIKR